LKHISTRSYLAYTLMTEIPLVSETSVDKQWLNWDFSFSRQKVWRWNPERVVLPALMSVTPQIFVR